MPCRKALNVASDGYSTSDKLLPGHIDSTEESSPDGFPEALALFDPYVYNPGEFLKRFRAARRTRDRSRERRSCALSIESVVEEKSYKETVNIE